MTNQEWVSVEERLPENETRVLIVEDGDVREAWIRSETYGHETYPQGRWTGQRVWENGHDCFHPTHWMPLPDPPERRET